MKIDLELTEKSAKNTQRWWKLTATIESRMVVYELVRKMVRVGRFGILNGTSWSVTSCTWYEMSRNPSMSLAFGVVRPHYPSVIQLSHIIAHTE